MSNFTVLLIGMIVQGVAFLVILWAIHYRLKALEQDLDDLENTVYQFDTLPPSLKIEDYNK